MSRRQDEGLVNHHVIQSLLEGADRALESRFFSSDQIVALGIRRRRCYQHSQFRIDVWCHAQ